MKRKYDEISKGDSEEIKQQGNGTNTTNAIYGPEIKRRKIEEQRVGEFVVDAKKAFYFKISNLTQSQLLVSKSQQETDSQYFSPLFGQKEHISGYENLNIEVNLSSKRLFPYISISYSKKAPAFANVHNLNEILQKEWGKYSTTLEEFQKVLDEEAQPNFMRPNGEKVLEFTSKDKNYEIIKVSLEDESFHEQSFYLQAVLPFFIDGASVIEPWPFWNYFLIYEKKSGNLAGFCTVYEAHLTSNSFRTKISQLLILPTHQKQGLGQKLYETIYKYYLNKENCFQLLVEDSAEDFQRIQDFINVKTLLEKSPDIPEKLKKLPMSALIQTEEQFQIFLPKSQKIKELSKLMKLQEHVILRVIDLMIYGFLDNNPQVFKCFTIWIKKKFYLRVMKQQITLMNDEKAKILENQDERGGLEQPYLYSSQFKKKNPFFNTQSEEEKEAKALQQVCAKDNIKRELDRLFEEQMKEFEGMKMKVKGLI